MSASVKIFTKCCKPLGGRKCSKGLRNVVEWMQKKNPSLSLNQKICDSCRKRLHSTDDWNYLASDLGEDSEGEPLTCDLNDSLVESGVDDDFLLSDKFDPPYVSKETAISLLNQFLAEVGEPPVDKKRLLQRNYCTAKVAIIASLLKTVIFCGHRSDTEISEDSGQVVITQLKDKFASSEDRSEKTRILTLVPQNWSILKIKSVFEGTTFTFFTVCSCLSCLRSSLVYNVECDVLSLCSVYLCQTKCFKG